MISPEPDWVRIAISIAFALVLWAVIVLNMGDDE